MITAMILAGGVGSRVGAGRPKQFIEVLGKPILAYTVEIFQKHPDIDAIEIVCHKDWKDYLQTMIRQYNLSKVRHIADAGNTFQESVMNGIEKLKDGQNENDFVLIHYGASPFTSEKIVTDVIRVMKERGASVTATPCYQLMGSNDADRTSKNWVDRDKYVQLASPYGFNFSYLCSVYDRAEEQGLIETVEPHTTSLIYALGDTIYQAYGNQTNIKITTMEDVFLFEGYVLMKQRRKEAEKS
jgi:2-C-methyl-D-erythritol 4-phosphate cytidylyltransferase